MIRLLSIALLALGLSATPVFAQPPKIFLASTGADTNDGSRAMPKRSLQAGHDAVAPGGEIVILDTAGYGPVTISKSVGIVVPPGVNGFVTATGNGNGISINAGANDIVTLRGLIIEGVRSASVNYGILANKVGTLVVEDTTVRNFAFGIEIYTHDDLRLVVRGGALRNNSYGIEAIAVPSSSTSPKIDALVTGTELTGNFFGIAVNSGNRSDSAVRVIASGCTISNGDTALRGFYPTAVIIIDACVITGTNQVFDSNNGSVFLTRHTNTITNNTVVGLVPGSLTGQ